MDDFLPGQDQFNDVTIVSVTWTDFPNPEPVPELDLDSDIAGVFKRVKYHFTVEVIENGLSRNIPIVVNVELQGAY